MTKFLNISTDTTLGGVSPSDEIVSSQKALKTYIDNNSGSGLPSQTGNAGKFLTTDGTDASWSDKPLINTATGTNSLTILGSATGNLTTVVGANSSAGEGASNTIVGSSITLKSGADNTIAIGRSLSNVPRSSIVIGSGTTSGGNSSAGQNVFIGGGTQTNGSFSTGIGQGTICNSQYGIALGYGARVEADKAIQLGYTGTNSDANTIKVANANGNFEIMSANGTIPEARLADTTSAAQGQVLTLDSNLDAVWASSTDANTDLSNLTDTGKNIGNWSSNVTNCITEIPQDINLKLNNGTLTLKAGSKIYLANGTLGDTVTIDNDISATQTNNGKYLVIRASDSSLYLASLNGCLSGTIASRPSSIPTASGLYFATDENKMYLTGDSGANWYQGADYSLPLALITVSGGAITSIDQIFNGFGYIGSTVFVLPGVKVLIPNGRNADGTLKNTTITTSSVQTLTNASNLTTNLWYVIKSNGSIENSLANYWTYSSQRNLWVHNDVVFDACIFAESNATSGGISNWKQKTSFHAVDYNDTEYIAHNAMPSDRYVDLSLGANGTVYTAPADGYIVLIKEATSIGQYIETWSGGSISTQAQASANGQYLYNYIPVSKGTSYGVNYTADGSTIRFRFIYANGSK